MSACVMHPPVALYTIALYEALLTIDNWYMLFNVDPVTIVELLFSLLQMQRMKNDVANAFLVQCQTCSKSQLI